MARFRIAVNGRERSVEVPPDLPMLDFLRDRLGLTGAKYGCGEGHCGAGMVLSDGVAAPSCLLAVGHMLSRVADPSEDEIREALAKNLCRCRVHLRVIRAVKRGARATRERARGPVLGVTCDRNAVPVDL